jgi:hypothetical protein
METWTIGKVHDVTDPDLGSRFSILDEHRAPLVHFGYHTRDKAERAAKAMEAVISEVASIVPAR